MDLLVNVTKVEQHTIKLSDEQVRKIAVEKSKLILETLVEKAIENFIRKLVKGKGSQIFFVKSQGGTHNLLEKDGDFDYHNDCYSDRYIRTMTLEEIHALVDFTADLTAATDILCWGKPK